SQSARREKPPQTSSEKNPEPPGTARLWVFLNFLVDKCLGDGRIHRGGIGLPNENLFIVATVVFLVHVVQNADLSVSRGYADELRNGGGRHPPPKGAEYRGIGGEPLGVPKPGFVPGGGHHS